MAKKSGARRKPVPHAPAARATRRARVPMPLVGAGVVVLALVAWWLLRTPAFTLVTSADQNVLLVTIDTLRYDALSCDGGRATTPNLDRLAADGARFTFAHASAPLTLPSHTTILTGLYPYEHGVRDNAATVSRRRFRRWRRG